MKNREVVQASEIPFLELKDSVIKFKDHKSWERVLKLIEDENIDPHWQEIVEDGLWEDHSLRTASLAVDLGQELGLSESELDDLAMAGIIHDLGKLDLSRDIWTKNGSLSNEEKKEVRKHARKTFERLAGNGRLKRPKKIAIAHHEHGEIEPYPRNGNGHEKNHHRQSDESIDLAAKILALADKVDSLAHKRPYREKDFSPVEIKDILAKRFPDDNNLIDMAIERIRK